MKYEFILNEKKKVAHIILLYSRNKGMKRSRAAFKYPSGEHDQEWEEILRKNKKLAQQNARLTKRVNTIIRGSIMNNDTEEFDDLANLYSSEKLHTTKEIRKWIEIANRYNANEIGKWCEGALKYWEIIEKTENFIPTPQPNTARGKLETVPEYEGQ